jgi:hypothetical protein
VKTLFSMRWCPLQFVKIEYTKLFICPQCSENRLRLVLNRACLIVLVTRLPWQNKPHLKRSEDRSFNYLRKVYL